MQNSSQNSSQNNCITLADIMRLMPTHQLFEVHELGSQRYGDTFTTMDEDRLDYLDLLHRKVINIASDYTVTPLIKITIDIK